MSRLVPTSPRALRLVLVVALVAGAGGAQADEGAPRRRLPPFPRDEVVGAVTSLTELPATLGLPTIDPEYHTPLAGKRLELELFGEHVVVPERDRGKTMALTLGVAVFSPEIGAQSVVPFGAFYWRHIDLDRRLRAVVSGVVNEIDFAERLGHAGFEAVAHFDDYCLPIPSAQIIDNRDLDFTSLVWGWNSAWFGAGWRTPLPPGEVDNDLQLQVGYVAGYWYFTGREEFDDRQNVPPDTYVHGVHARVRLDAITRNLLELPHRGVAAGFDAEFLRRDVWEDHGAIVPATGRKQFEERQTRDYTRLSAHVVVAAGLPFLSERHRFVGQVHGLWAPQGDLDRFSGFRVGGGPPPTEAADLQRSPWAGAMFDQYTVVDGVLASLEYRLEVLFFLFVHLRATLASCRTPTYKGTLGPPGPYRFTRRSGTSYSAAISSGFLWESSLYLEYSYDTGALRAEEDGHSVLVLWSKSL